jgi:hypothetical protein
MLALTLVVVVVVLLFCCRAWFAWIIIIIIACEIELSVDLSWYHFDRLSDRVLACVRQRWFVVYITNVIVGLTNAGGGGPREPWSRE